MGVRRDLGVSRVRVGYDDTPVHGGKMGSAVQLSGRLALVAGLCALSIAAGWTWFYVRYGIGLDLRFMGLLESWDLLFGYVGLALLFQYGLPFLCVGAFFFGVSARGRWTARVGMAGAGVSLVAYARFIWLLYHAVAGP